MKNTRSIVCLGATALLFGCSAGVKPTPVGTGGTGPGVAGSSGGGTTGAGGNGTSGSSGFDASFDLTVSDTKSDGVCSSTMTAAEPVPLDLYVLMESSKSMNDPTSAGPSKWDAVTSAMNMFFADPAANGLGIALKYFPQEQNVPETCEMDSQCGSYGPCDFRLACIKNNTSAVVDTSSQLCATAATTCTGAMETCQGIKDCTTAGMSPCVQQGTTATPCDARCTNFSGYCHSRDICAAASYATPDVPIATLPGAATALMTSLGVHKPGGFPPTGPALGGALMFARARIAAMPTHRVAIVLVTDGLPGGFIPGVPPAECMPTSIPAQGSDTGIAPLLSGPMGTGGTPPVNTFVIGVFSPGIAAQTAQTNLNMLATAGKTAPAVIIDTSQDVSTALRNALKQVQSKAIACQYNIPSTGVDPTKVNVSFTSGAGTATTIGHTMLDGTDGSGCDARGGWYYDTANPTTTAPTKITACPASCSMFQTDLNGHVDVVLGCPTISVD